MFSNVERGNFDIRERQFFEENSEEYRCCCQCCHLKTGSVIVGIVELVILAYFSANSVISVTTTQGTLGVDGSASSPEILGPFFVALCFIGLALLAVILLFVGIGRRCEYLLLPHLILQVVSVILLTALIIILTLAVATNRTIFYRLSTSVAFAAPPDENTVSLGSDQKAVVFTALSFSCLTVLLEIWFFLIVYRCYKYLSQKAAYARYCHAYSMPMKSVSPRHNAPPIPQYFHG